jgi:HSP20 family protein
MDLLKRRRDDVDWNDWLMMPRWFDWSDPLRRMPTDALRVEEFEHDGELVIKAEMPGIDPDKDVEITMTDHTLRIKAERRQETTVDQNESFHTEFRYGSFTRLVELPSGASDKDVKATYDKGILEVHVPINATVPTKRIAVSTQ